MSKWYIIFKIDGSLDDVEEIIDFEREFKKGGLLSSFFRKVKNNVAIDMKSMFKTIIIINEINRLVVEVEEEFVEILNSFTITEKKALHLKAKQNFTDIYEKDRKAGDEWLVTKELASSHIVDINEIRVG